MMKKSVNARLIVPAEPVGCAAQCNLGLFPLEMGWHLGLRCCSILGDCIGYSCSKNRWS